MYFTGNRTDVAQFVSVLLQVLSLGLRSTTVTKLASSEDWSVLIVTDGSLDDIVKRTARTYSLQPMSTSPQNTPVG